MSNSNKGVPPLLTWLGIVILVLMALAIVCMVFGCTAHAQRREVYTYDGETVDLRLPVAQPRDTRPLYIAAGACFVLANICDWQLQTEQHGWPGTLWEPGTRGARWPWYGDWIPHDGYHLAQVGHTTGMIGGAACIAFAGGDWWKRAIEIVAMYAGARLLFFSVPRYLTIKY